VPLLTNCKDTYNFCSQCILVWCEFSGTSLWLNLQYDQKLHCFSCKVFIVADWWQPNLQCL
jgi:hypothetical protein